jgi:4-amino-4-deoxychorismate lyase
LIDRHHCEPLDPGSQTVGEVHRVLCDGRDLDCITATDRGLQYGDGLFETILMRDGAPCLWDRHMARLARGAERLGIALPPRATLRDEAFRVGAGLGDGILKLIVTRGVGGRGYCPPARPHPRRIVLSYAATPVEGRHETEGVTARYCDTPASVNSRLAGIKHLNRLDAVLARSEWDDPQIAEGLMCDEAGRIVGGTMTNLFVWDGIRLATPSVERSGIAGTVRAIAIETAARAGVPCVERPVIRGEIERAAGLFLTNARIGVWPVARLADRRFDPDRLPVALLSAIRQAAHTPQWPDP